MTHTFHLKDSAFEVDMFLYELTTAYKKFGHLEIRAQLLNLIGSDVLDLVRKR